MLLTLSSIGFIEDENVVQPDGVADKVWGLFHMVPIIGFTLAIIILLLFYKLRTNDVRIMSEYNNGVIDKKTAQTLLNHNFEDGSLLTSAKYDHLSNWMESISDNIPLRKIVIPGSHDSGTKGMLWPWQTQKYDIAEQLELGIRYFDIRVNKKRGKEFYPDKGQSQKTDCQGL